jgi:CubicO group peptidase (beta-lactamase class C family)
MKDVAIFLFSVICCMVLISNLSAHGEIESEEINHTNSNEEVEKQLVKSLGSSVDPNDLIITSGDCSDYVDLSGMVLPIEVAGTTVGASNDYGPFTERPGCWRGDWDAQSCAGPDVAYKWTAPYSSEYTISLCGSYFDNCLLLYQFTCPSEPVYPDNFICGADDVCYLRAKIRYVHLDAGEEILIVVDGSGSSADDFELRIYESEIDDMDWFMNTQIETFHIPGASACIVKDGQIDWTGSYGLADIGNNIPVTDSTLFMLASISKTVTAIALMQLWEDSLFDLDADINDYLDFSVRNPFFPSIPITFRMLMTHTSSIRDCWSTFSTLRTWGGDSPIPLGDFMEDYLTPAGIYYDDACNFYQYPPGSDSGSQYSNVGAALTAYLLEEISPYDSFAQYCNDNIFDPLGMDETSWYLADLDTNNIAIPYDWNGVNQIPLQHYSDPWFPSASLRTSASQLARHLIAFMQYGMIDTVRLLDSTTVELMRTIQYPSLRPNQGLYWYWADFGLRRLLGHGGNYYGCETRMFFEPDENTGVIVLTNGEPNYTLGAMVNHLFEYAAGPAGIVAGVVTDQSTNPIENVYAKILGEKRSDYSNQNGAFVIGGLVTGSFDVRFRHADYEEVVVEDVSVVIGETTYVDIFMQPPCDYVVGDVNGSDSYNGLDITYGVAFFKGGPAPHCPLGSCYIPPCDAFFYCGDVNGSCSYNGLDITYGVAYFKGGAAPIPCSNCPPVE